MGGGASKVDYGYLRQVGGLVQVLSEAIAQGKGVFGRELGVEEATEAGGEGGAGDGAIGRDGGTRNLGHG